MTRRIPRHSTAQLERDRARLRVLDNGRRLARKLHREATERSLQCYPPGTPPPMPVLARWCADFAQLCGGVEWDVQITMGFLIKGLTLTIGRTRTLVGPPPSAIEAGPSREAIERLIEAYNANQQAIAAALNQRVVWPAGAMGLAKGKR